jgi:hypothetical protein
MAGVAEQVYIRVVLVKGTKHSQGTMQNISQQLKCLNI